MPCLYTGTISCLSIITICDCIQSQFHACIATCTVSESQRYTCIDGSTTDNGYFQYDRYRFYSAGTVSSASATLPKLTQSCTAAHECTQWSCISIRKAACRKAYARAPPAVPGSDFSARSVHTRASCWNERNTRAISSTRMSHSSLHRWARARALSHSKRSAC